MIPNSWIVILDGGANREELITGTCPGARIQYGEDKWVRVKANDFLRVAVYHRESKPKPAVPA